MEIAGIDQRLIGWQSTRRQQIEDAISVLTVRGEARACAGGAGGLRAGLPGRRPDAPAQAHGAAVADRAADAMAHLSEPGVRGLHRLPAGGAWWSPSSASRAAVEEAKGGKGDVVIAALGTGPVRGSGLRIPPLKHRRNRGRRGGPTTRL